MPPAPPRYDFLWGNGAYAAAFVMARGSLETPGEGADDIADLPAFAYVVDGESAR